MVPGAVDTPNPTLSERWSDVGHQATVTVETVELWTAELPFMDPVATARGVHRRRPLVLVRIVGEHRSDGAATADPVEGWGECAALVDTAFDEEDAARSLEVLGHHLVPSLFEQMASEHGTLPGPSDLGGLRRAAPRAPLAFAALEMAVADTHLRSEDQSLAGILGVAGRTVEPGAVVGTADTVDDLLGRVGHLVDQGYSRLKMKIAPGWDVEPVAALVEAYPDLRIQVDANTSYRPGGTGSGSGDRLLRLDPFGLLCIEQPFNRADLQAHPRLASRMSTAICLDESLDSPGRVDEALALGACSVVCVKPARLGGLGAALSVIDRCRQSGVPLWMGGMFESGYARGVNATLGALEGMSWPGDLSPSRSYLGDDLVPDDRSAPAGPQTRPDGSHAPPVRALPSGAGMGPPPTAMALARHGTLRQVIKAAPG